ncbi:hypothetical protein DM01DRAFT_1338709 [Hesseltinella vesiculosa]|uniref:RING-type domain-containing protein n=1 Tax=Hesseltinella vesiculosa TaxID=101127 RepID=A0A1X2G941_9FUNG|nr:hypothetical protein DM01DRAFT_1338709 [Hesseltinella vesiculosa]
MTSQQEEMTEHSPPSTESQPHDDESDLGSSADDLDFWVQRCSICFDAPLDFCLDFCRDQYCVDCFQRYVTEVVKSSWGLSVTKVKCPVCQVLVPQSEWSQYVPRAIVEHYNKYNQPFRSFTRCCPACENEAVPCDAHLKPNLLHPRFLCEKVQTMADGCVLDNNQHFKQKLNDLLPQLQTDIWSPTGLLELYQQTMDVAIAINQHHRDHQIPTTVSPYDISSAFLVIEMPPESWKQMQFLHIGYFPNTTCSSCSITFCLQCGFENHSPQSCEENMKHMTLANDDTMQTVQWQLKHSRRCPSCSIMINRDEGCNKVDCSLCGFTFCWSCRSPWSEKCGFYHCAQTGDSNEKSYSSDYNVSPTITPPTFNASLLFYPSPTHRPSWAYLIFQPSMLDCPWM